MPQRVGATGMAEDRGDCIGPIMPEGAAEVEEAPAANEPLAGPRAVTDEVDPARRPFRLPAREPEVAEFMCQADQHPQLLMPHVEQRQRRLLVIPLLGFDDEPIDVIRRAANLLRQAVLLVPREVVEVHVQELRELHELPVQPRFRVQAHRYRSGRQRYKAARNPTLA